MTDDTYLCNDNLCVLIIILSVKGNISHGIFGAKPFAESNSTHLAQK